MPKLMIVICSTRPGRVGLPIGQWFHQRAVEHGDFEVDLVDLKELALPFMEEPKHPRLRQYTFQHTKDWSTRVESADAFVFVMPEYNHGYNAPLKNAIDYLVQEWGHKPVGFVSYGGIAAGTRAQQMIKPVLTNLKMVPVTDAVLLPFVAQMIEQGQFRSTDATNAAAKALLDELVRWEGLLRPARASVNPA